MYSWVSTGFDETEDSEEDAGAEDCSEEEGACEAEETEETSEEDEDSAEEDGGSWEAELDCPPHEARDKSIAPKIGTSFCFFISLLPYLVTTKVW